MPVRSSTKKTSKKNADLLKKAYAPLGIAPFKRGDLLSIDDGQTMYVARVRGLNSNNRYEVDLYHAAYGKHFAQIYFDSNRGAWMSHHQHWPVTVGLYKDGKRGFDTLRCKMGIAIKGPVDLADDDDSVPF